MARTYQKRNLGRSTGRARRRYMRLWARLRRRDKAFRLKEAARNRVYRSIGDRRERERLRRIEWAKANAERISVQNKRYHRECRATYCYFCGRTGRPGRHCGVKPVLRMAPGPRGLLVEREVLCCDRCRG